MEATTGLHAADEVADGKNEGELPVTFCILGQIFDKEGMENENNEFETYYFAQYGG